MMFDIQGAIDRARVARINELTQQLEQMGNDWAQLKKEAGNLHQAVAAANKRITELSLENTQLKTNLGYSRLNVKTLREQNDKLTNPFCIKPGAVYYMPPTHSGYDIQIAALHERLDNAITNSRGNTERLARLEKAEEARQVRELKPIDRMLAEPRANIKAVKRGGLFSTLVSVTFANGATQEFQLNSTSDASTFETLCRSAK